MSGAEYVKAQAIEAATARLKHAAKIVELHSPKVFFSKTVKLPSCSSLVLRIESPGVLRVFDSLTGELLAESIPGKLDQPNPDFCPQLAT